MSDYSEAHQIADAKAEAYWSQVERRKARRWAAHVEQVSWPLCCQCDQDRVMAARAILCRSCDAEARRLFSPDEYARMFGQEG